MTKTCQLCASEFEAKRSDAAYCSEKCRAKSNYQIRKRKDNITTSTDNYEDNSPISLTDKSVKTKKNHIKGSINIEELLQIVGNCENKLEQLNATKSAFSAQNTTLNGQILDLQHKYDEIMKDKVVKLKLVISKPDSIIYNRYLNSEYISAEKAGNSFAKSKLLTEKDLQEKLNYHLLHKVKNYKLKIENQMITLQTEANHINAEIINLSAQIDNHKNSIDDFAQQTRFYQNRIIRFEQLLSK